MAAAGPLAASLRLLPLFPLLLVILSHSGQSLSVLSTEDGDTNLQHYDELTTSLVVNQLAILKMMEDTANVSSVTAETLLQHGQRHTDEAAEQTKRLEEALKLHLEQAALALGAGQERRKQELLETITNNIRTAAEAISNSINSAAEDSLAGVAELLEELRQMARSIQEAYTQTPPTKAPETPSYHATVLHNDTVPSFCSGDKVLVGSRGSLEVVRTGTYSDSLRCSWNITLPTTAPLSLQWDYLDTEDHTSCSYDWVLVTDITNSNANVYGRKLCGKLTSTSTLEIFSVVLPPTKNILVSFRSDGSNTGRGFRLNYGVPQPILH